MKKLIVHAGPHKTGSTYIQSLMHNNRDLLASQGIVYPEVYYLYLGHHYLLNELNGKTDASEIRTKLIESSGDKDTCVISSENFISITAAGIEKLKKAFPDVSVTFVIYLRRPSIRLVSKWHEEVKQGGFESMEGYFLRHVIRPMQSKEINLSHYIKNVCRVFGDSSVSLVDYDTASQEKNIMACFLKAGGLNVAIKDTDTVVNKMSSLEEVEILRVLNYRAFEEGLLKGSNVREVYYLLKKENPHVDVLAKELCEGIRRFSKNVTLGSTGFDFSVMKAMENNYGESLVNGLNVPKDESVSYPSTDWMLDEKLQGKANKLSASILGKM